MTSNPSSSADQPLSGTTVPGSVPGKAPEEPPVKFTRAAAVWSALIVGFLILILLLIFIAQNTASAQFAFFGWRWSLPLGVAILLAAVGGGLITVFAGTARILQLRRAAKKTHAAALRANWASPTRDYPLFLAISARPRAISGATTSGTDSAAVSFPSACSDMRRR